MLLLDSQLQNSQIKLGPVSTSRLSASKQSKLDANLANFNYHPVALEQEPLEKEDLRIPSTETVDK